MVIAGGCPNGSCELLDATVDPSVCVLERFETLLERIMNRPSLFRVRIEIAEYQDQTRSYWEAAA